MQFTYTDNERSGSLLKFILVFAVVFSAGFGLMIFSKSGGSQTAEHPLMQKSQQSAPPFARNS